MEKINRRRLPMLHWQTAHALTPDFENQLAASVFLQLHSELKHDCICTSHGITIFDEWSYLPSNSFIVSQCLLIARNSINNISEAIATGWIDSPKINYFGDDIELVEPTAKACERNIYHRVYPTTDQKELYSTLDNEIKSSQSETWDFVIDELENSQCKAIQCIRESTVVVFPFNYLGNRYEIISRTGEKHVAEVHDTGEKFEWKLIDKNDAQNVQQDYIVAWKRID